MPGSSQGLFKWPVDFFLALVDCIYPQRQRQKKQLEASPPKDEEEDTTTMAKTLVLSTG